MNRILSFVFAILFLQACIPLRTAPRIDEYKVTKGKGFKKNLPQREMFIFQDPKQAGEFYTYINTKFQLDHIDVYDDVPFELGGMPYFFSFYEVDIPDKTLNLFPFLFEAALNKGEDIESEPEEVRRDNFYIAIEVYSDSENDCLSMEALSRELVLNYLRNLREEYLTTDNYNELVLEN